MEDSNMSLEFEEFNKLLQEEMKRSYSERAIEYVLNPKNLGPMEEANGYATVADSHGDELHIWLIIDDDRIKKASFFTKGCITIKIAGSAMTELVPGKTLEEAMGITPKTLRDFIGRTPRKTWHCTILAVDALRAAIRNHVIFSVFNNPNNKTVRIDL
jgi:NifU-like protein involved in Fe-S cluster formation